jgi:hypothetical protein
MSDTSDRSLAKSISSNQDLHLRGLPDAAMILEWALSFHFSYLDAEEGRSLSFTSSFSRPYRILSSLSFALFFLSFFRLAFDSSSEDEEDDEEGGSPSGPGFLGTLSFSGDG